MFLVRCRVVFVFLGATSILVASWQNRIYLASLPAQNIPEIPLRQFFWLVAFGLGLLGLVLAAYLLV